MSTLQDDDQKVRREDEIDARANEMFENHPDLADKENQAGSNQYSSNGLDQLEAYANDSKNSSRDEVKGREESNPLGYQPGTGKSNKSRFFSKVNLKKYGPAGGILGIIFGGLFGIGVLFSPSLALIHMKEIITGDLNDQVGAMELRTNSVWRAKLKNIGKSYGSCTVVKFRCGLSGMTDRQIKNFEKAGIKVALTDDGAKNPVTRKSGIKSLTFTDKAGNPVVISNQSDISKLRLDSSLRSQLRRAYNPIFYGMWDKTAGKAYAKYKLSKADKLKGTSPKELNESFDNAMEGRNANIEADTKKVSDDDPDKESKLAQNAEAEETASKIKKSGGFGSVFKGGAKGIGVLGVVDNACTVLNTSLLVESGAKGIRAAQLANYASILLTVADQQKASSSTLTAEKVSFIGEKVMATDTNKTVVNETSTFGDDKEPTEVPNPNYGKNAFDSAGYKASAYNEAPTLDARAQQFMIGGAMVGTLSKVNNTILNVIGAGNRKQAKSECKIVQNGFVRGGSIIVGIVVGAISFGTATAVSVGASIAVAAVLPILEGYLKDMFAGDVVSSATNGVDAGNALFAGSSAIFGQAAQARGMQPASKEQMKSYLAATKSTRDEYIADESEAAKDTPFDISNQYSFVGSLSRKLLPISSKTPASGGTVASFFSSLNTLATSSLMPSAYAMNDYNESRFTKCTDTGYNTLKIDADIMCNPRYILSPAELAMDTDENYAWMQKYVNEDGLPKDPDNQYGQWITQCLEREVPYGDFVGEDDDDGRDCLDNFSEEKGGKYSLEELQRFRVFTLDRSIEQGMDEGPSTGEASVGTTDTGSVEGRIPELAQIVLDNSGNGKTFNIKGGYSEVGPRNAQDKTARATAQLELEDMAAGKLPMSSTYSCSAGFTPPSPVTPNLNLMRFLADVGKNSGLKGVQLNSLFGQCHSITSSHYKGAAVDFGCNSAATADTEIIKKMDEIGKKYGIARNWENCANDAHWHYGIVN